MMHDVIKALIEKGEEVLVSKKGVRVMGFYKSDSVLLTMSSENPNVLLATARYDEVTEINSFDDLVHLNFVWWERSKARGWGDPTGFWLEEFKRLGLVKVKTVEVVEIVRVR